MLIRMYNNNNFQLNKKYIFILLYVSLVISFYFGENSTGGALEITTTRND